MQQTKKRQHFQKDKGTSIVLVNADIACKVQYIAISLIKYW